jgi:hypothetical protein
LAGAIHRVVALMKYLPTLIDQQLRHDADLGRFEYAILLMLPREPDRTLPMLDLSLVTFGSLSRLSHTVTKLCGRGFPTRERRGANRDATLTNNGHKALVAAAPGHVAEARRHCRTSTDSTNPENKATGNGGPCEATYLATRRIFMSQRGAGVDGCWRCTINSSERRTVGTHIRSIWAEDPINALRCHPLESI